MCVCVTRVHVGLFTHARVARGRTNVDIDNIVILVVALAKAVSDTDTKATDFFLSKACLAHMYMYTSSRPHLMQYRRDQFQGRIVSVENQLLKV